MKTMNCKSYEVYCPFECFMDQFQPCDETKSCKQQGMGKLMHTPEATATTRWVSTKQAGEWLLAFVDKYKNLPVNFKAKLKKFWRDMVVAHGLDMYVPPKRPARGRGGRGGYRGRGRGY